MKLVERERLRDRLPDEEAYKEYFESEELKKLFDDLVADKLAIAMITLLLRDNPLTSAEIASTLELPPADVTKHLKTSTRRGLVGLKCYALA
jgi:DNA-binding MarR family transcriptional regulator